MATQKRSLTGILRELHQQLDPEAPRHLPLAERRQAVAPLLTTLGSVGEAIADAVDAATDGAGNEGGNGGSSNDRRGNESSPARRAGTRTADGTGKPQGQASQQQRREARGVRVVSTDPQPSEPAAPKPVTRKPVVKPVKPKSGDSNAAKLWRLLIG